MSVFIFFSSEEGGALTVDGMLDASICFTLQLQLLYGLHYCMTFTPERCEASMATRVPMVISRRGCLCVV